jgi:phosphoribosyl-AMP cyclohydrolase
MNREEGLELNLEFKKYADGLMPAVVQDVETGRVLMVGFVNPEALNVNLDKKLATFWTRSRKKIWTKGESSGNTLKVVDVYVDCDQDTVLYRVQVQKGGACHTKNEQGEYRESCFYRRIVGDHLEFIEGME